MKKIIVACITIVGVAITMRSPIIAQQQPVPTYCEYRPWTPVPYPTPPPEGGDCVNRPTIHIRYIPIINK